jgi:hypothetical protein
MKTAPQKPGAPKTTAKILDLPTGSSGAGWSSLSEFVRCEKADQYKRVRGIQKFENYLSEGLSVGALMHAARAQWLTDGYKGDDWKTQIEKHAVKLEADGDRLAPNARTIALKNFQGYVDYWLRHPRSQVLAVEYELTPRGVWTGAPQWAHRTARLDSVERFMSKTWIGEAKSTYHGGASRIRTTYALHGQILMQLSLWGDAETKRFGPLAGVLLDPMVKEGKGKATGGERTAIALDKVQHALSWFRRDIKLWIQGQQAMAWNDVAPRRLSPDNCRGCQFRELCTQGRDGAVRFHFRDGTPITKWKSSPGREVPPWD